MIPYGVQTANQSWLGLARYPREAAEKALRKWPDNVLLGALIEVDDGLEPVYLHTQRLLDEMGIQDP